MDLEHVANGLYLLALIGGWAGLLTLLGVIADAWERHHPEP